MNPAPLWPTLAVLAVVWLPLFNQLHSDWAINPQYAYGFAVPPLALALLARRWQTRPAPAPDARGATWLLLGVLVLLAPLRLIEEANPEWRLVLWAHALGLAGFTLALLQQLGGAAWRRHLAFPVGFLLMAVPWPIRLEQAVIQNLMRGVASVTVELAGLMDIPALRHGNLIEISTGLVGVDEACSGVRSVQTTLMVAIFLGELYWFSAARRTALVAAGLLVALPANVGRTFFLVWVAARQGFDAMHRAHDGAGMVVIALVLPTLWGVALLLRRGAAARAAAAEPASAGAAPRWLPWRTAAAVLVLVALTEAGTEAWYRAHEQHAVPNARWTIAWPTSQSAFGEVEISDTARAILRCDTGRGVSWRDAAAHQWQMFFLRWEPGKNSAQLAKGHTPDICLPGTGHRLRAEHSAVRINVHGLELPFRHYEFGAGGRTLFVFYCLWEDRAIAAAVAEDGTVGSRLEAVRAGRRHLGQQVLELAVEGPATAAESVAALRGQLEHLIAR
jgi:exosortase